MKKIVVKNSAIVPIFEFLQEVTLKGIASRGRTTFSKRLEEKQKEYNEALIELRKEYFKVDEAGELIVKDGEYIPKGDKDVKELTEKIKDLNDEDIEIHYGEYSTKYEAMFEKIAALDVELKGTQAFGYNELLDAYEAVEQAPKKEKGGK